MMVSIQEQVGLENKSISFDRFKICILVTEEKLWRKIVDINFKTHQRAFKFIFILVGKKN